MLFIRQYSLIFFVFFAIIEIIVEYIKMNKLDLLKFFSKYEGEVSEGDFDADELIKVVGSDRVKTQKEIADEYFSYYDDVKDRVRGHEDW